MKNSNSKNRLLKKLDESIAKYEFPTFENNNDREIISGEKRVIGYASKKEISLVFECVEYSYKEGRIQTMLYCFATFPATKWITFGNGISIPSEIISDPKTGEFILVPGNFSINIREKTFMVKFIPTSANMYADLLKSVCSQIPKENLFSTDEYIKKVFGMPKDMRQVFSINKWIHPTFEEIYIEKSLPSSYQDILMMVEMLDKA